MIITLIGIDPGIIDTGGVALRLDTAKLQHEVDYERLPGLDPVEAARFVQEQELNGDEAHTWVEAYRERGTGFTTNTDMRRFEQEIRLHIPGAKIIDNTGVKQVVTRELMEVFDLWKFKVPTHHNDLRSAARILLYGALKDDRLNTVITDFVVHHTDTH